MTVKKRDGFERIWPCFARPQSLRLLPIAVLSGFLFSNANADCKMWFQTSWRKFGDRYRPSEVFVVDNGNLQVEFTRDTFWTIGQIFFRKALIGQASGGTGSVVHWDGKPVGTVHREGDISEKLISVELTVDGKTVPLFADGQEAEITSYFQGKNVVLVKTSMIGPFRHQARFTFTDGSDALQVKNDYETMEAITPERFAGYRYVFMHMMPLDMTEYLSLESDGQAIPGTTRDLDLKALKVLWERPIRGFAIYSPENQVGVCYFYPEAYPGTSHFGYRGGKDTKFRSILFDKEQYAAGEKLSWSMTLAPFSATLEDWVKTATGLMNPGKD